MDDELIDKLRYHASCDIVHRWFAYFDGKTEKTELHLAMFSQDIRLIHGESELIASGHDDMSRWLQDLPIKTTSHYVQCFKMTELQYNQSEISLLVGYQVGGEDGAISNSIFEYKIIVAFDSSNLAKFRCIHKNLLFSKRENKYKNAFNENRMQSFIANLHYLVLSGQCYKLSDLYAREQACSDIVLLQNLIRRAKPEKIFVESKSPHSGEIDLVIPLNGHIAKARLRLIDRGGRYPMFDILSLIRKRIT